MPIINVEAGEVSKEQKETLIAGLTKLASETLGIDAEHFFVLVKENELDNWGVGGEMFSNRLKKNTGL